MTQEELREYLSDRGYDDVVLFENFDYADAFIGVSSDGRAIYDYEKMADSLVKREGWSYEDAIEWIDYNTIRALPYGGNDAPIIMYPLEV